MADWPINCGYEPQISQMTPVIKAPEGGLGKQEGQVALGCSPESHSQTGFGTFFLNVYEAIYISEWAK